MTWISFLNAIDSKTIQFATYRPSGSALALLDRRVSLIGPQAVLNLVKEPDISLLPFLIDLLKDAKKAWAAEIILTAITGSDGKIIESFSGEPEEWGKTVGLNAYERWNNWYQENKEHIQWDIEKKIFRLAA